MVSFAPSLASHIGTLIANLSKKNLKTVIAESNQLADLYGPDGSLILLRVCLEQKLDPDGKTQNQQPKIHLLLSVFEKLVAQPNFASLLCQAVTLIPKVVAEDFLSDLTKAVKLPLHQQLALGLALTEAKSGNWSLEGERFLLEILSEVCENPGVVGPLPEPLLTRLLLLIQNNERFSRMAGPFREATGELRSHSEVPLVQKPLLIDDVHDVDCLRDFFSESASTVSSFGDMAAELKSSGHAADVMEELGYRCSVSAEHCKELLALFPTLSEEEIARVIGMMVRPPGGEADPLGVVHHTFTTALLASQASSSGSSVASGGSTASESSPALTSWNVDAVVEAIKQTVSTLSSVKVAEGFDHEGFLVSDQKAFVLLMTVYTRLCADPFPVTAVCGRVWQNPEGQISFLRQAVAAGPELFSFADSPRKQPPVEGLHGHKSPYGTPNHAWLSLDLLEVLCLLAEAGHLSNVRPLLEYPQKHCAEVLLLGVAQVTTPWNLLQAEVISSLMPIYLANHPNSSTVMHLLWPLNKIVVISSMVEAHSKDPSMIARILDVCQDLKELRTVLERTPFPFAIDLAALASRREFLNLEKWLQDGITTHRNSLYQAVLKFLRDKVISDARQDGQPAAGQAVQRTGPIINLSLETIAIFFKLLRTRGQHVSTELADEASQLYAVAVKMNQKLAMVGSEQPTPESFATDIEEEANSYFQKVYNGQMKISEVVEMLKSFSKSNNQREEEIFACMIQCLFDEYRFFPSYPENYLHTTAVLFGSLISNQLVSAITLGIALRCVLDALRKSPDSKMSVFGLIALQQFMDRLREWPQYCNQILQIPHMHEKHRDIVEYIKTIRNCAPATQADLTLSATVPLPGSMNGQLASLQALPQPTVQGQSSIADDSIRKLAGLSLAPLAKPGSPITGTQQQPQPAASSQPTQQQQQQQQPPQPQPSPQQPQGVASDSAPVEMLASIGAGRHVIVPGRSGGGQDHVHRITANGQSTGAAGVMRSSSKTPGFGHALNIETLVAAAERREGPPIEVPGQEVQDKVAFIINNISLANIDVKSKELMDILKEQYYPWFAQYMVMKRASIEPNFHELYLKFMDKINSKNLQKEIVKAAYENCKVLLRSELIKSSSEERSLLKNLGSWLGRLTIGRNKSLLAREIDPKSLLIEAYEKGSMIAVVPFTSKILEPCQASIAYQPPNPWTMGILNLLAEIAHLPNLKMNIKFDIEVLFKNLSVDMKDLKPTQLLKGRPREMESNPDFSTKDAGIAHAASLPEPTPSAAASIGHQIQYGGGADGSAGAGGLRSMASHQPAPGGAPLQAPSMAAAHALPMQTPGDVEEKAGVVGPERVTLTNQGMVQSANVAQAAYNMQQQLQVQMAVPNNLASMVVHNSKLAGLSQLQLPRIVPQAMDRAIREIISPAVERSVTIACMTTRELVMKDYALEAEEGRIHRAANLMVASLAGSLAHVTCKEPLRNAMNVHLGTLLQGSLSGEILEQAVQLITNEYLDLGCAVIEKAATEKALRDLEENLGAALIRRRQQRDALGAAYYESLYSNLARLPEALRPKLGCLSPAQHRVYEDFGRLHWQAGQSPNTPQQMSPPNMQQPGGAPPASAANAGPAPGGRMPLQPYSLNQMVQQSLPGFNGPVQMGVATVQGVGGVNLASMPIGSLGMQPMSAGMFEDIGRATPPPHMRVSPNFPLAAAAGMQQEQNARSLSDMGFGLGFHTGATGPTMMMDSATESPAQAKALSMAPSTASSLDQAGAGSVELTLSMSDAIEKYHLVSLKMDMLLGKVSQQVYAALPADHEIRALVSDVPEIITQCISRDEAALAIAQMEFKRLYEDGGTQFHQFHLSVHLVILEGIRTVCKRVVKEITSWVIYSDEERKFNLEVTVGLIRSGLISLSEYNLHLVKLVDNGRNNNATDFAIHLVKTCIVQEPIVNATELYNVIDALSKIAQRPNSNESLQQLVDLARNSATSDGGQYGAVGAKEDKGRMKGEKKSGSGRATVVKEEGKSGNQQGAAGDPVGLREKVGALFEDWAQICDSPVGGEKAYALYISRLQLSGLLKGDDISDRFFRILTELSVAHSLSTADNSGGSQGTLVFTAIDMYSKLVVLLVKFYVDPSGSNAMSKVNLLNRVLGVTLKVILRDGDEKKMAFNPRPYFRLFVNWFMDFNQPDPNNLDSNNFLVLTAFGLALYGLQPLRVPGFSFSWLELVSHRMFMSKLLQANQQKGWPLFQKLLVALFKFMEPYLRNADLSEPVRLLYKGTLRVLLVLLHDFPEFLCDNHFSFCDVIPPSCIQMRNLILSAFPRNMRLPDPFTPNLKVDLLPEISQSPRILSEVDLALRIKQMKGDVDEYLKTREPPTFLSDLKQRLLLAPQEALQCGTRYNVPLINSLVLYVGMQAIQQLQSKTSPQQMAAPTPSITQSAPTDIFQKLITDLDTDGRYLFLNAIANQLRYPNNHTHYFSCVLLYLFADANQEIIQEQITRVLLERLIVNRPHPWGLLITFIELIKNPRYNFWSHGFTRCAPEIEKLFESVARSCMAPPVKPPDDERMASLTAEQLRA